MKEKEYLHEMEMITAKSQNDIKKDEENLKNQLAASVLGGMFEGVFSKNSPISKEINNAIASGFKDAMNKSNGGEENI